MAFLGVSNGDQWRVIKADLSKEHVWSNVDETIIPIGSTDGWEIETEDPSIIKNGDLYQMWYTSSTQNWVDGSDRFRTRYAYSHDGNNWNIHDGWVLKGTKDYWDEGGTGRGRSIVFINGQYHMWYAATNTSSLVSSPYWRIGYATSSDGINWVKQNNNQPVINPTEPWEHANSSYPRVIYDQNKFKMWYATGDGDLPSNIAYAESVDGVHWTKPADQNPVLSTSENGFDSVYVADPFVIKEGNEYKMFYGGYDGNKWAIGIASTSTSDTGSNTVPLLKQTSEPWQGLEYDSASIWNPSNTSINTWGCALTSAAMVLQYYNYTKLPDGTALDPGTLNTWLKNQPDGYVGNGLVNCSRFPAFQKKQLQQITSRTLMLWSFPDQDTTRQLLILI